MKLDQVITFLGFLGILSVISSFILSDIVLVVAFIIWFVMGIIKIIHEDQKLAIQ